MCHTCKMSTNIGSNFKVGPIFLKMLPMSPSGHKESGKYTVPISDVWFLSYGLKGQRSKTFVNFGHMGSNIKNCQICKIFLNFSFEILQFISSKAKYR